MIENLRPVDGEPITNRARYWVHRMLQESDIKTTRVAIEGVSRKTIWNFISNGRSITIERLARIADHLDCDVRDFFRPTPEEMKKLNQR